MIFSSQDAITWTRILTNRTSAPNGLNYVFPVNVGETKDYFLAYDDFKLWVSTDGGINWSNSSLTISTGFGGAYWLSNGKNVCWFGSNFTCAPITKNLIDADQWETMNVPNFYDLKAPPVVLQGQFVVASSISGLVATSATGMNSSWVVTTNEYIPSLNSFNSNQKMIVGVGNYGLLTSATF